MHNAKLRTYSLWVKAWFEYTWSQIASLRDQSNLKPRSVFRLSAYCGIIDSRKKLSLNRAVAGFEFDHQLSTPPDARGQINVERWLLRVGQSGPERST